MLKVIKGDLFEGAVGDCIIAHGVNPQAVMGSGFAKLVRDKYPSNFLEYKTWCYRGKATLGSWLFVYEKVQERSGLATKGIFNFVTQLEYGRDQGRVYVDYGSVKCGLQVMADFNKAWGWPIHFPFIGGGLANGDKQKLMAIYEEVFKDADGVLYLKE